MESGDARHSFVDKQRAKSLQGMADARIKFIENIRLTEENSAILVSEAYQALLEVVQAIITSEGFKVYSHKCVTYFLEDYMGMETLSEKFDKFRKIRNKINYYGKTLDVKTGKEFIAEIFSLINQLRTRYNSMNLSQRST